MMEFKSNEIFAERNSPSDEELVCISVLVKNGDFVLKNRVIYEIEGAKAIFEVVSESDGYFYSIVKEGDIFKVGQKIGYLKEIEIENFSETLIDQDLTMISVNGQNEVSATRFSEPALLYLENQSNNQELIAKFKNSTTLITLAMIKEVEEELKRATPKMSSIESEFWSKFVSESAAEDCCILIGGGYGAIQTLDLLNQIGGMKPIGYLSDFSENLISQIGLPNLGSATRESIQSAREKFPDAKVVLTVGSSPEFRFKVSNLSEELGFSLETLIHPSAIVSSNVQIGTGTLIFANVHIGTGTHIGKACFISSNSSIEHHNAIGDGFCTGPNLNTSGGVEIGEKVRFGIGVSVEPGIVVGSNCTVASGLVITKNVGEGSVQKARN
jgi:acetyltransferase-like isoleucine patch superfamily enzyme